MESDYIALIPCYKPDGRLASTARALLDAGFGRVIIVNDGSGAGYCDFFDAASRIEGVEIVSHTVNMGKGRALKTGFNYILDRFPGQSVVSVDSDGQHRAKDAYKAAELSELHPDALILGCRSFSKTANIPLANYLGNVLTRVTVRLLTGVRFSDTQCGLRAYSPQVMRELCEVEGERFEFENNTLLYVKKRGLKCVEFPVSVTYEERGKYVTTFRRAADSARIYGLFLRFILAPVLSFLFASVLMLLLTWGKKSADINGVFMALSLLAGFLLCALTVKNKLLYAFSGVLISVLYGAGAYLLLREGFAPSAVYLILLLPCAVLSCLAFRSLGVGWRPKIIRYKGDIPD